MSSINRMTFGKLSLRLILLLAPTIALAYFGLKQFMVMIFDRYADLDQGLFADWTWLGLAMLVSYLLYSFRIRFSITFLLLMVGLWMMGKAVQKLPGEFDVFYQSIRYQFVSNVVLCGWLCGFLLARWRYFPVLLAVLVLLIVIPSETMSVVSLKATPSFLSSSPLYLRIFYVLVGAVSYVMYMMYMSEAIRDMQELKGRRVLRAALMVIPFLLLVAGLLFTSAYIKRFDFKKIQDRLSQSTGDGNNNQTSMMQRDSSGNLDLNRYAELRNELGQSNNLLMCAHLDNYFPDPDSTPNPLYFVRYYYTIYNQKYQRFERDPLMPYNDEFSPDVNKIPLFHTYTDSNMIKNGLSNLMRRTVTADVYVTTPAMSSCVTPATGYSVQPITVEDDFKKQFKLAYKTQSYISELNSAYFVYNSEEPAIRQFQENRNSILRTIPEYKNVPRNFMDYFTTMPKGTFYDSLKTLSNDITKDAKTPIDKVLAVRDYFLQKDLNGDPLFWYSLTVNKADEPNIANASMLRRFLYDTHKGYCTYYAAATFFLLRAQGIPVRMAGGFLTEDRNSENKGWYWFYENQAHAWVQVYFPGYGWLDFDTTVSNSSDPRSAPAPDGTPPVQPPKAWFAVNAFVTDDPDTTARELQIRFNKYVFHKAEMTVKGEAELTINAAFAAISDGKNKKSLRDIHKGDSVLVVAYDDPTKKDVPKFIPNENSATQLKRFPKKVLADEIRIKPKALKKTDPKKQDDKKTAKGNSIPWLWITGGLFLLVLLIITMLPRIIGARLRARAGRNSDPKEKAYHIYRAATYHLNQLGNVRGNETPLEYAKNHIDKKFGTSFEAFMIVYLKIKYAKMEPNQNDIAVMQSFWKDFRTKVNSKYSFFKRMGWYFHLGMTRKFFYRPVDELDRL